jgi:hypothetical protein
MGIFGCKNDNFVGCLTKLLASDEANIGYLFYYQQDIHMARDLLNDLPNTHQGG